MMVKLLGIIGGFCFSYCGLPAAYRTVKHGYNAGVPVDVAWMITLGGIAMYSYLTLSHGFDLLLTVNYGIEVLSWASIVFYHYFPRVTPLEYLVKTTTKESYEHAGSILSQGAILPVEPIPEELVLPVSREGR